MSEKLEEIRERCLLRRRKPGERDPFNYFADVSHLLDCYEALEEEVEALHIALEASGEKREELESENERLRVNRAAIE